MTEKMKKDEKILPKYISIFSKHFPLMKALENQQLGILIKYLIEYTYNYFECENTLTEIEIDPLTFGVFKAMQPDIDNMMNKYKASIENGKKGGAPTGNKNAVKAKLELEELEKDEKNKDISNLICILYEEGKNENFDIEQYFSKPQISNIAVCMSINNLDSFQDVTNFLEDPYNQFKTFHDLSQEVSPDKLVKDLKSITKDCFESEEFDYKTLYKDLQGRANFMLKFSYDEICRFADECLD